MTSYIVPGYIQVVRKEENRWIVTTPESVVNFSGKPYDHRNPEEMFGLTRMGILKELYLKFHGLDGFYIAHMGEREYYYCGPEIDDVNKKIRELGILIQGDFD